MRFSKYLFLSTLFFLALEGFGQTFNFKNYNTLDGLSQAYIYTLNQGPKGKLYIGTGEGLTRFDGKNFTSYTVADGLAENFVTASITDMSDRIWFGHYEGSITIYDGNSFKKLSLGKICQSPINALFQDKAGIMWIGTQNDGIIKIEKGKIQSFKNTFSTLVIYAINKDEDDNLLVATSDGIFVCKLINNKLNVVKKLLSEIAVLQLTSLKNNKDFLVGTKEHGLHKLTHSKGSNKFEIKKIYGELGFNFNYINIIREDKDENIWLGCYGSGITKNKIIDNRLINLEEYNVNSGLSNNYVKSFFIDREENIWVGTFGGGLDHLLNPIFTLYTSQDRLLTNNITSVFNDKNNTVWVGSEKGLNKLSFHNSKEKNTIAGYPFQKNILKGINSIEEDDDGNLLLGSSNDGIWKFDIKQEKYSSWLNITNNLQNKKINSIIKDKSNNLWIATEEGALQYNLTTKTLKHFTMEDGLVHNNIFSIYIDSKNSVWFATHGTGLSCYKNGQIINYKSPNIASGLDINCIIEDNIGNLWIGTYGQGVYIFNGKDFLNKYSLNHGLGSNYCYSINKDIRNNIWIGHKNGISKFNASKQTFTFYQKKEGFLVEEVNTNAIINDKVGNVWFGTVHGLLKYNIKVDKPHLKGPIVNIQGLKLFFQDVDWSKYSDSLVGLDSIPYNLVLSHDKNHLTFHSIGVSLSNPEKIKYQYKLDGFENEWSLITNEPFITYANLPPGNYTFKARAQNSFEVWSEHPTDFSFTILNPFWKTWWFILLSMVSTVGIFFFIVRIRIRSLQKRQQELENEKIKLEAEIKERKLAQKKQKISEKKLKQTNQELNTFIYRSSHDLRGPLSTVKGLTQLGVMEVKEEAALKYFNLISDRVNRLDFILTDLINIVEIIESDINATLINFEEIVSTVLTDLGDIQLTNKIEIKRSFNTSEAYYSDYKLIYTIFKNIIDNSIKYKSTDRRTPFVSIDVSDAIGGVKISISDNGIGVNDDIKHKVFDMFFRGTDQSKGSGLGLYIIHKIVNGKLNGSLKLESVYKESTNIECYLPTLKKGEIIIN